MRTSLIALMMCLPLVSMAMETLSLEKESRDDYLQRAEVWKPVEVSKQNILTGPQNLIVVKPEAEVTCRYQEWEEPPSGVTPKFLCKLVDTGEIVRVKYGHQTREIFAEVAASRLFWALGFSADELYPVRLTCLGCPEKNPFKPEKGERRTTVKYQYAVIEPNFDGVLIEEKEDQGWTWKELEKVEVSKGGASATQIDALKLLAVFVQHGDNRGRQQRLACLSQDVANDICMRPVLMIDDLGATFGKAGWTQGKTGKMNFKAWSSAPIWDPLEEGKHFERTGRRVCIGFITSSKLSREDGLETPVISEKGRAFLAGLLNHLTDDQIRDLFIVARADELGQTIEEDGVQRPITIEDWVAAFKEKRDKINDRTCPQ